MHFFHSLYIVCIYIYIHTHGRNIDEEERGSGGRRRVAGVDAMKAVGSAHQTRAIILSRPVLTEALLWLHCSPDGLEMASPFTSPAGLPAPHDIASFCFVLTSPGSQGSAV